MKYNEAINIINKMPKHIIEKYIGHNINRLLIEKIKSDLEQHEYLIKTYPMNDKFNEVISTILSRTEDLLKNEHSLSVRKKVSPHDFTPKLQVFVDSNETTVIIPYDLVEDIYYFAESSLTTIDELAKVLADKLNEFYFL